MTMEQEKLVAQLEPGVARLSARGIRRSYRKNTIILNEGEPGDSLFVLLQGQVKVYATDENGREITYGTIQAGDYFGEMSLDGGPRSASVMTMENCLCSLVSRAAVQQHLRTSPVLRCHSDAGHPPCPFRHGNRASHGIARCVRPRDPPLEGQQGAASIQAPVQPRRSPTSNRQPGGRIARDGQRLLKDLERAATWNWASSGSR